MYMYYHNHHYHHNTLQEENFHWNLNFAISHMANSLNINSAKDQIFKNISIMAYMKKTQKSKFANILFRELDHSGQGRLIEFGVYFYPI